MVPDPEESSTLLLLLKAEADVQVVVCPVHPAQPDPLVDLDVQESPEPLACPVCLANHHNHHVNH